MLTLEATQTLRGVAESATTVTITVLGDESDTSGSAEDFKTLYQGQLAAAAATLYTAPASHSALVKTITVRNTNAGATKWFELFIGGTAAANSIAKFTIPADGTAVYDGNAWSIYNASGQVSLVGSTGATGATGATGSTGATGATGEPSGHKYTWKSSTTMADPSTGNMRYNNATPASVTAIAIYETDANSIDASGFLSALDDSTSTLRSYITIRNSSGSVRHTYSISAAITDNGSWDQLTVTWVTGTGTFSADDTVYIAGSRTGDKGDTGATGSTGSTGSTGAAGADSGIPWKYSTTTTNADPTAGFFRLNNATIASATALYISETDNNANNVAAWIATWDDSTNTSVKGYIRFVKQGTPATFGIFSFSATLTDNGTWDTFTVTHVASAGTWSNNDVFIITVARTGDVGATGAAGTNGSNGATGATGPAPAGQLWLSTAGMWPSITNGAGYPTLIEMATNKNTVWGASFADAVTSYLECTVAMPSDWNAGTVTAKFYWEIANASGNAVVWQIEGAAWGDNEALDLAYGTPQTVTDANNGSGKNNISAATGACTISGTPAAGDLVNFRIARVGGNGSDTMTATTVYLLGVMITYTRS